MVAVSTGKAAHAAATLNDLWERLKDKREDSNPVNRLIDLKEAFGELREEFAQATTRAFKPEETTGKPEYEKILHLPANTDPSGSEKRQGQGADKQPIERVQPATKRREQADTADVELATVMRACPDFAEIAHGLSGYVRNWGEFSQVASQIRPMAGISDNAWQMAQSEVGPHLSAAMLALIYDKYSKGEEKSPGGYLRGMIEKAKCGLETRT